MKTVMTKAEAVMRSAVKNSVEGSSREETQPTTNTWRLNQISAVGI